MAERPNAHDWRAAANAPPETTSRKATLFVAMLLAGILGAVLVGLWLSIGGDAGPRFISISLYDLNNEAWPPAAYAKSDADRLKNHFDEKTREVAAEVREDPRYKDKLEQIKSLGDRPLILHVSGLAVARGNQVYLLGARANPSNEELGWFPVAELLNAVAECPAKKKLLILDVVRPIADPACGVLAERTSAVLQAQLEKAVRDKPQIGLVLVNASPGEFGYALDEEGATSFTYFIDQGLAGAADGKGGPQDGRVFASELINYVEDNVKRWAHFARGLSQTPYHVGECEFLLTTPQSRYQRIDKEKLAIEAAKEKDKDYKPPELKYPEWLATAWEMRDAWVKADGRVVAPNVVRQLERDLIKAEAQLAAGESVDEVKRKFTVRRGIAEKNWATFKAATEPPKTHLCLGDVTVPQGSDGALSRWLAATDPAGKQVKGGLIKEVAPNEKEPAKALPLVLATVWDRMCNVAMKRDLIKAMVPEAVPPGEIEYPEGTLLLLTGELVNNEKIFGNKNSWNAPEVSKAGGASVYPADTLLSACQAERGYREALAAMTPESFVWFRGQLDPLLTKRLSADKEFKSLGDETNRTYLDSAKKAKDQYDAIAKVTIDMRKDAKDASAAYEMLADAMGRLPGYADLLLQLDRTGGDEGLDLWTRAVDAALLLASDYDRGRPGTRENTEAVRIDFLRLQSEQLRQALSGLDRLLEALSNRSGPPEYEVVTALLSSPCLNAKKRGEIWVLWHKHCKGNNWVHEDPDKRIHASSKAVGFDANHEFRRATRRAKIGLDLIRLAGIPIDKRSEEYQKLSHESDPAAWDDFAKELAPLFSKPAEPGASAVRASRVFGTTNAASRDAAEFRYNFWQWLAERYDSERSAVRGSADAARAFYLNAGKQCAAAAQRAQAAAK